MKALTYHDFAGVAGAFEVDFKLRQAEIPTRNTPKWLTDIAADIAFKDDILDITAGLRPIGFLPPNTIIRDSAERQQILNLLKAIPVKNYEGISDEQRIKAWGLPFVDSPTVTEHLTTKVDPRILELTEPLVRRLELWLTSLGFNVTKLTDPFTGLAYPAGVFRSMNVSKEAGAIHVDDFIRDGLLKPDFRLPYLLEQYEYVQISFNALLCDGGHEPDNLYAFNRFYQHSDEEHLLPNGWQFPASLVAGSPVYRHRPVVGQDYVFNTCNYHDVKGG